MDPKRLKGRLAYIFKGGLTKALIALGWEQYEDPDEARVLRFKKKVGDVVEILVFRKSEAFANGEIKEAIMNTRGITYEDFEKEYIAAYKGEPPLMPM